MGWSIRLGTVAGTAVRLHLTFLLLLVWIWIMHYRIGGTAAAWEGVWYVLAVFGCVLLHEFGHVAAARAYGIRTPDITLLPIGGVARLERMPEKPLQELVVAVAGPLVNIVIAALLFLYLGSVPDARNLAELENPQLSFLGRLAAVNVFLVLFNAIPAFPMDGGRVLRALLAWRLGSARATEIAASLGKGLAIIFGFLGLLYNPLLIFIGIFVYLAAAAEAQQAQLKEVAIGTPITDAMVTRFATLPPMATLDDAVDALLRTSQHEFPVLDAARRLTGIVTRDSLIAALREHGPGASITTAMRTGIPTLDHRACLEEGLRRLHENGAVVLGITDRAGRLVGLLTTENVGEMVMVRSALRGQEDPSTRRFPAAS